MKWVQKCIPWSKLHTSAYNSENDIQKCITLGKLLCKSLLGKMHTNIIEEIYTKMQDFHEAFRGEKQTDMVMWQTELIKIRNRETKLDRFAHPSF